MAPGYWGSAWKHDPLVRLSDAEAIIAQKDASIQRLAAQLELNNPALEEAANTIDQQAERIKELESEILEQCRINGMGAERESALLGKVAQQSAALKLAKAATEAVIRYQTLLESGKPHGLINSYGTAYESCVEALAAIDALGEVK